MLKNHQKFDKSQAKKYPAFGGRTGMKSGYLLLIIIVIQRYLIFLGLIIERQFFLIMWLLVAECCVL